MYVYRLSKVKILSYSVLKVKKQNKFVFLDNNTIKNNGNYLFFSFYTIFTTVNVETMKAQLNQMNSI
jgi:hypothetical protein